MVYTANGGFIIDGRRLRREVPLSRSGSPRGRRSWSGSRANGFAGVRARWRSTRARATSCSSATRSSPAPASAPTGDSHRELARGLRPGGRQPPLVDPRFYHLDTAISVLDPVEGPAAWTARTSPTCPERFDDGSRRILAERYPDAIRVVGRGRRRASVSTRRATATTSSSRRGRRASRRSCASAATTRSLVDLSELLLGGGGIKCCTLELRGASR